MMARRAGLVVGCALALAGCSDRAEIAEDASARRDQPAAPVGDGADWPRGVEVFEAPSAASEGAPRTIEVLASGEVLGQFGIAYSPRPRRGDFVFVDGWALQFTELIVTVGELRIEGRGPSPDDQSRVGAPVARLARAFAIDLQKPGPRDGAGGRPETAHLLHVFARTDRGEALDPESKYSFSFAFQTSRADAVNVNLGPAQQALYRDMIARGWSTLVRGRAQYRGTPAAAPPFGEYPVEVAFSFGFGAPAQYINCDNPENAAGDPRGVQPNATRAVRAQITLHADHVFWSALQIEHPPLRFDPFAARAQTAGPLGRLSLDDLATVAPTNLRDRQGRRVPDRAGQTLGAAVPDPEAVSFSPNGAASVRDLRDFVAYSTRAAGHLNGEGLCAVRALRPFTY